MDPDEDSNPDSGTEEVNTQTPDTAEDLNWYDPDDDQDTEANSDVAATEDGDETAENAEVVEPVEASPDAVVTLADGTKAKVADLIQGSLRQEDYTRKTQEVAAARKTVEADAKRIEGITQAFIDHLSKLVPEAPEPALALRDPNAYVRAKAQHEAAVAQVQKLIEIGEQPKQITDAMSADEKNRMIADENRKLSERIPETATAAGRAKFFEGAAQAAQEIGFTMDELQGFTDHRMFVVAHYAKIGMDAVKARATAKTKAQTAPPVAPRKPAGAKGEGNLKAMQKLARSGSIRDALKVDWD